MKIDNCINDFVDCDVCFLGIPLIKSRTPNKLTYKGPDILRFAINNKDDFDLKSGKNVFDEIKMCDLGNKLSIKGLSKEYLNQKLFFFGGEHTITKLVMDEFLDKFGDFHFVIFDAHLDLRTGWEDNACFLRSIVERLPKNRVHLVGQRAYSKEEYDFIKSKGLKIEKNVNLRNKKVYISFDIDVVDSVFVPTCSTPEPFGKSLEYYNKSLIKLVKNNKLLGIDFVEFSGKEHDITYSNIASVVINILKTLLLK